MAKLPTAADLGLPDVPVSSRPIQDYDAGIVPRAALAAGQQAVEGVGLAAAGLQKFAEHKQAADDALAVAMGGSQVLQTQLALDKELQEQQGQPDSPWANPADWAQTYADRMAQAKDAALSGISDPTLKAKTSIAFDDRIATAVSKVQQKAFDLGQSARTASVMTNLDTLARSGAQADEPTDRVQAREAATGFINGLVASGAITPLQGQEQLKAWTATALAGRAQWLDAQNKPAEALAYVQQHASEFMPAQLDALVGHLRGRVEGQVTATAANRALYGGGPAAPAGADSGTAAPATPPDAATAPVAAPAATTAPPNRTGLPPLADVWQRIQSDPTLTDDRMRDMAFNHARTLYVAQEADAARAERLSVEQQRQAVENRTNEIWADAYSDSPTITAQRIAVDPAFNSNPERRAAMITLVNNPPGLGIPAPQSYLAAQALVDRIRLPYGDPNKITTADQVYAQIRTLNKPDLEFVLKTLDHSLAPGREQFNQRVKDFLAAVRPQIERSGVIEELPVDGRGRMRFYEIQNALDQKIDAYLKTGKDPNDLLDPSKDDYMGKPEALKPFKRTMAEALADFKTDLGGGAEATASSPLGTAKPLGATNVLDPEKIKSLADLQAAVKANPALRDPAVIFATGKGWIAASPPPPAERVSPPMVH
jgi:hypothetical protein